MTDEQLRQAQLCQLDIAVEVKRICKKYNLDYCLGYGTLLGAVRHKGFIPWDDDLDILMSRKNYEKFIRICDTELSGDYFLQSFISDSHYGWPFVKILKNNTIYKEAWVPDKTINGVFVDIFPIDIAPNNKKKAIMQKKIYNFYLRLLHLKLGYKGFLEDSNFKKVIKKVLGVCSKLYSVKKLKKKLNYLMIKYNDSDGCFVHNLASSYNEEKELMPRKWIEEFEELEFEGEMFSVSCYYDLYLKKIYGDYMSLPPESDRVCRHQIKEFSI